MKEFMSKAKKPMIFIILAALIVVVCLCVPLVLQIQDERGQIGKNYVTIKPGTAPTIPVSEPK